MQINKSKKDQISIAELNIYVRKKKRRRKVFVCVEVMHYYY